MSTNSLKSLFLNPRSVAFIGIPRKNGPGSLNPVDNLKRWGYEGQIHLVHPHVSEIAGLPVVPKISDIKAPIDLAVISTPRETVPGIIRECAVKGIRAVIVTNQGFAEADRRGSQLQEAMMKEARLGGIRILGPNTLGVVNGFDRFNTSFMPLVRDETRVGVICQSGVFFVGSAQLTGGMGLGVDIGNACDLDAADALDWISTDARLKVIAMHIEGITRSRYFIEAAKRVSLKVPVVTLKTGRSPEGAKAAATHSGSMVGEDAIVDTAMRQAGLIRINETHEMRDLVRGFLRLPPMRGKRVAIITLTGAGGIILLDAIGAVDLQVAKLSYDSLKRVQDLSPSWMPLGNPMDIWPALMKHGMKKVFRLALKDVINDPTVHGVICVALGLPPEEQKYLGAIDVIQELSETAEKPIIVWCYGSQAADAVNALEEGGRALTVDSLERGVKVLAHMAKYEEWKNQNSR